MNLTKIENNFKGKDIISLSQFDSKSLLFLFEHVSQMADIAKNAKPSDILSGNIATLLFYEPSSRTFGSFDASVKQLGGQTVAIINPQQFSSVSKGETLEDTIRVFESYCDVIILRHPEAGAAERAAEAAKFVPVINAGDGIGEHPTQALLDLYTIYDKFKKLDSLNVVIAGDLVNGRTVHSLLQGLSYFENNTVTLLAPSKLKLPEDTVKQLEKRGLKLFEIEKETDIPKDAHVWYWTRVQKERFHDASEYEALKNTYIVTPKLLETYGNDTMILMHPLPRVGEIAPEVDTDSRAVYLRDEVRNGMYVRMALIALILGKIE